MPNTKSVHKLIKGQRLVIFLYVILLLLFLGFVVFNEVTSSIFILTSSSTIIAFLVREIKTLFALSAFVELYSHVLQSKNDYSAIEIKNIKEMHIALINKRLYPKELTVSKINSLIPKKRALLKQSA